MLILFATSLLDKPCSNCINTSYLSLKIIKRFCPVCPRELEDVLYFIVQCPIYNRPRSELWNKIKRTMPDFYYLSDVKSLFWFFLKLNNISLFSAHFIHTAYDLRNALIIRYKGRASPNAIGALIYFINSVFFTYLSLHNIL